MIRVIDDSSDPGVRARVEAALAEAGARVMPFKIARTGVRVEVRTDDTESLSWFGMDSAYSATKTSVSSPVVGSVVGASEEAAATR